MSSNSKQPSSDKPSESKANRTAFSIIHYIVSVWRGYIYLHSLALVILLLIIIITKQIFTLNGLLLALGAALYILLYLLEKWLEKFE